MSFWDKLAIKEKKMYSNLTLAFSSFFHPACCPRLASFLLFWVKFKRWFDICQAEKGRLVKLFFEWETFGNSEMYSGEITQNFGLLSNIRFIWKSLKKYHFTRFDKKLLPAFRGTLTTYLASTFPFHNSFISYDSTCTSWDQIDTFDIKFSKSSKILLRHFWWFSNTAWEQAKEEWEEERRGGEGGRGSKVCKLAKMRVVAFSLLTLLSATQYWR